jgi:hypothetical protein
MDIASKILKVANSEIKYFKLSHVCPNDFCIISKENNWIFDFEEDINGWECDWHGYITIKEDLSVYIQGSMYYGTATIYDKN